MRLKGSSRGPDREYYLTDGGKLWVPAGRGLFTPSWNDLMKLAWLRLFGLGVVTEQPAIAGGSGFSGGGGGAAGTDRYVITIDNEAASSALVANTTYTLIARDGIENSISAGGARYSRIIPVASTCTAAYWQIDIRSTEGTAAQTVTHKVRKNEATDSTGVAFDYADAGVPVRATGAETGLSIAFAAADRLDGIIVTPAVWTTPAAGVRAHVGFLFTVP